MHKLCSNLRQFHPREQYEFRLYALSAFPALQLTNLHQYFRSHDIFSRTIIACCDLQVWLFIAYGQFHPVPPCATALTFTLSYMVSIRRLSRLRPKILKGGRSLRRDLYGAKPAVFAGRESVYENERRLVIARYSSLGITVDRLTASNVPHS